MGLCETKLKYMILGTCAPEVAIKRIDNKLHSIDTMGCNSLSLPLIPASDIQVLIWGDPQGEMRWVQMGWGMRWDDDGAWDEMTYGEIVEINEFKWNEMQMRFSYTLSREYWVVRNRYSRFYSLVKIAFAQICACKNNRRIWRHNASISRSRDVTYQLWWRHNAKAENTFLRDNDEMNDRRLFFAKLCAQDIKFE